MMLVRPISVKPGVETVPSMDEVDSKTQIDLSLTPAPVKVFVIVERITDAHFGSSQTLHEVTESKSVDRLVLNTTPQGLVTRKSQAKGVEDSRS